MVLVVVAVYSLTLSVPKTKLLIALMGLTAYDVALLQLAEGVV